MNDQWTQIDFVFLLVSELDEMMKPLVSLHMCVKNEA